MKMSKKTRRRLLSVGVSYSIWLALCPVGASADCVGEFDSCTQTFYNGGDGCTEWGPVGTEEYNVCNDLVDQGGSTTIDDVCNAGCCASSCWPGSCPDGCPKTKKKKIRSRHKK